MFYLCFSEICMFEKFYLGWEWVFSLTRISFLLRSTNQVWVRNITSVGVSYYLATWILFHHSTPRAICYCSINLNKLIFFFNTTAHIHLGLSLLTFPFMISYHSPYRCICRSFLHNQTTLICSLSIYLQSVLLQLFHEYIHF